MRSLPLLAASLLMPTAQAQPALTELVALQRQTDVLAELAATQAAAALPNLWRFAGRELQGESIVKGAPFCATAVSESVQALMDGNRIVRKQSTALCRDGEGRTRREVQREGGSRLVYLHDPVARQAWVLDPEKKSVRSLLQWSGAPGVRIERRLGEIEFSEQLRANSERWRDWAREMANRARGEAEGALREVRAARSAASAQAGVVMEERVVAKDGGEPKREVRVMRMGDWPREMALAPLPPMPPMPPLAAMPQQHWAWGTPARSGGVTTALPPKEIDGVKVNGERTTWTLEAGRIGNEKPIVSTREVWRSPELMLTLSHRETDPQRGETHYRLENLKRGEPDAALMKVPADYSAPTQAPAKPVAPKV